MPEKAPAISPALKTMARTFYLENAAMNEAKGKAEKRRSVLFAAMEEAGLPAFDFATTNAKGDPIRLQAAVGSPDTVEVNLQGIIDEVGVEPFLEMVTVSKKSVVDVAGEEVWRKVSSTVVGGGKRNVTVKPAK